MTQELEAMRVSPTWFRPLAIVAAVAAPAIAPALVGDEKTLQDLEFAYVKVEPDPIAHLRRVGRQVGL